MNYRFGAGNTFLFVKQKYLTAFKNTWGTVFALSESGPQVRGFPNRRLFNAPTVLNQLNFERLNKVPLAKLLGAIFFVTNLMAY
jgi:hypothetical protein